MQAHADETDHGQGGEENEGPLSEVEDARSLEDQHEAEGHQRVHDALQQAVEDHLEIEWPGEEADQTGGGQTLMEVSQGGDNDRH